jgi:hypothetical protein
MSGIFPGQSGSDAGWSAADFVALSLPRLPEKLTPQVVREAVARTLTSQVKAYDVADECVRLGLRPKGEGEDPWASKWMYIERRVRHLKLPELVELARKVTDILCRANTRPWSLISCFSLSTPLCGTR